MAFRGILVAALFFAFASARDTRFSRRAVITWVTLTVVLACYVALLEWGPRLTSRENLVIQVTGQKICVTVILAAIAWLSREAERA
jgi:hypothetical protein